MLSVIILQLSLQYSAHASPLSHSPINLPLINLELIVLKASGPQENKPQSIIALPPCFTWKKDLVLVCHHTHTVVFCRVIFGSPLFHVLPFMYNCYVFISLLFSGAPQLQKWLYNLFQTERSQLLCFSFVPEFPWIAA